MKQIISDKNLIASCGLYCGACRQYMVEKCPGCRENEKAGWCKVRTCCMENSYLSCADCKKVNDTSECKKLNNFISKIFAFVFRSDRKACIDKIKTSGYEVYAEDMTNKKTMTIKK